MLKNVSQLKPAPQPAQHNVHRSQVDYGAIERLAIAMETMAAMFLRSSSGQANRPSLMSYEEASEVTGLGRSTLESMVNSGRFHEGRHYIREGRSIRFHYNLIDLMFEDKMPVSEGNVRENADSRAPDEAPTTKHQARPSRSGPRMALDHP